MRIDPEATSPLSQAVVKQLASVLASAAFKNSQRSSKLLQYVVDRTLDGQTDRLKERLLGTEVFGRAPDYDTSADHVVRSTAGEIRRRLAQYYLQPECEDEVRIDLLPGSYIPQFHAKTPRSGNQTQIIEPERIELLVAAAGTPRNGRPGRAWRVSGVLAVGAAALGALYSFSARGAIERLWNPLLESPSPIAICLGDPRSAWAGSEASAFASFPAAGTPSKPPVNPIIPAKFWFNQSIPFGDAVTVSRLGAIIAKQGKTYHVVYSPDSTLSDLRQNSAVLVGGIDNFWTMHLTRDLRYRFQLDLSRHTIFIEDQKKPTRRDWEVIVDQPRNGVSVDYAIVARLIHPATGRPVLIAGGIRDCGTLAAGEFLTSALSVADLEGRAPGKWTNVEAVIATKVFRGTPGPPEIVAAYFW